MRAVWYDFASSFDALCKALDAGPEVRGMVAT